MQIGFVGIQAAMDKLKKHQLLIKGQIADTKRRIVRHVLTDLITNSPQWSGNLATQWHLEVSGRGGAYSPISSYQPPEEWHPYGKERFVRGKDPAVAETKAREFEKIPSIKWNSKVRIVNYAPYAVAVENNIGPTQGGVTRKIRKENLINGAVAMVGYASMKYNNLRYLRKLAE